MIGAVRWPIGFAAPQNNAMHPTKGARSGRFAAGHLEAPFAGDCECCAGVADKGREAVK